MDRAELLQRASRYRALAVGATDEPTREALLDLAEQYEALAKEVEKGTDETDTTARPAAVGG